MLDNLGAMWVNVSVRLFGTDNTPAMNSGSNTIYNDNFGEKKKLMLHFRVCIGVKY